MLVVAVMGQSLPAVGDHPRLAKYSALLTFGTAQLTICFIA